MSFNALDNISDFFGDIAIKLESNPIGLAKMGTAGMTSGLHRANTAQFFFKKDYAQLSPSERNAIFGMALATVSAKQATRMVMVALPVMSKIDPTSIPIMKKMASDMPRSNAETTPDSITPVRMAAAFPDIAVVGACLNNQAQVTKIFSRWENREIWYPSCLAFAQAYQLDLDEDLKKISAHYNVTYWMDTVRARLEVDDGPKFNYTYMRTGVSDKYVPFLAKNKLEAPVLAYFQEKVPFNLEKLMKYHMAVNMAFRETQKVSLARLNDQYLELTSSDEFAALEDEVIQVSEVTMDMMPDGSKQAVSGTDKFITGRNRQMLAGQAATTTIIERALPAAADATTMRILDDITKRMANIPMGSSNTALTMKMDQLRVRYPRMDEDTLKTMAAEELAKDQSKPLMYRMLGW